MDVEFHYYMTYLIAARAGFSPKDAGTISYACQHVDDNKARVLVGEGTAGFYRNYISQTMNILKPKKKLFRIYPLFHFLPGEYDASAARRRDGTMHRLNTTPGSANAEEMMNMALTSKDLHRIGVACHTYADTWAHQNFIGYFTPFNALKGPLDEVTPDVGHADAGHAPDRPAGTWRDDRLLGEREVNNKERFLAAAAALFDHLRKYTDPDCDKKTMQEDREALLVDLEQAIGEEDSANDYQSSRIARYRALGKEEPYGRREIPEYDETAWFREAIAHEPGWFENKLASLFDRKESLEWADPKHYEKTHWYRFQEAVKAHQKETWQLLEGSTFDHLDLESL